MKPHEHLQTLSKTPAKFQKDPVNFVGCIHKIPSVYILYRSRNQYIRATTSLAKA